MNNRLSSNWDSIAICASKRAPSKKAPQPTLQQIADKYGLSLSFVKSFYEKETDQHSQGKR